MKRISLYITLIIALLLCIWLWMHGQSKPKASPPSTGVTTNAAAAPNETYHFDLEKERREWIERIQKMTQYYHEKSPVWYKTSGEVLTRSEVSKLYVRPDGVDDEGWAYLQFMLELIFEVNQPMEFYARVEDQNSQPVPEARLELYFSGVNTDTVLEKFPHMNMGEEQARWTNTFLSDKEGWIRVKGMAGSLIHVLSLTKDGYSWTMPQIGSFGYEPEGKKSVGYSEMRDAFDPAKGYIFHMQKE